MMVMKEDTVFSIKCKRSIEYCFCCCPYCGDLMENCHCNLNDSSKNDKFLPTKQEFKPHRVKQSTELPLDNTKDDDWWRLEKWQIGRRNFP